MLNDRIIIRLKRETKKRLEKLAGRESRKPSEMARLILEKVIDKKESKE